MDAGHTSPAAVVGAVVSLTLLAGVAVGLRLFTRCFIVYKPGLDDTFIVLALVGSIMQGVSMVLQVKYGLGQHIYDLSQYQQTHALMFLWASIWPYYAALGFAKCSILIQYLRILPHPAIRITCFVMLFICGAYYLAATMTSVFMCTPVSHFWNESEPGTCLNRTAVWSVRTKAIEFTNAGMNIVTDLALAVIPIPVVRSLKLPRPQKIALGVVFGLAALTCIISILRLHSLYVVSKATDVTYKNPLAAIWTCAELNCCILCSCIPTLKACVCRFFPRMFGCTATRSAPPEVELNAPSGFTSTMKSQSGKGGDGEIHVLTAFECQTDDSLAPHHSQAGSDDTRHLAKYDSFAAQGWGYEVKCESGRAESDDV